MTLPPVILYEVRIVLDAIRVLARWENMLRRLTRLSTHKTGITKTIARYLSMGHASISLPICSIDQRGGTSLEPCWYWLQVP
jgi:hypothetical protein